MSYELTGKLHEKSATESKSETFQSREFVVLTDGQYQQYIKFQLSQDKCDVIEPYNVGDQLNVKFDLRGRQWEDKYFTNLQAWSVSKV